LEQTVFGVGDAMTERLPYAKNFRELVVYQKSRRLAREVFHLSKRFPKEETYSLTDQLRRASRAIGANIAEAWGKRSYERHFLSKLTDADAEQYETQHWLEIAIDCGYIAATDGRPLIAACEEIGRLLGGVMARSAAFCNPTALREPLVEYFILEAANDDQVEH